MSNHLAIAAVTAAMARTLTAAAQVGVAQASVRLGPPDAASGQGGKPLVNLFLYKADANPQRRNAHLPARRADSSPAARAAVALDLRYLLSFYGDAARFEPERMLAAVAAALEDQPLISGDAIRQAMLDHAAELGGADLADAPSPVRITPEAYTLDDLSKLWSVFFQVPYALSAAYMCSHVSIETGADAAPAQPISRRGAWVAPVNGVAVTGLEGGAGPGAPIVWGGALTVRGRGLNAPGLRLRIGGRDVPLAEGEAQADAIRIDLTPARFGGAELQAGVHRVQAVLPPPPGAPDHLARATDARAFGLRPQLTVNAVDPDPGAPAGEARGVLTVGFVPAAAQGQQVRLMLDERIAAAPRAAILAPDPPGAFPAAELRFAYAGLRPGRHLVRAQVDGVESAVELDATPGAPTEGEITGPEADLP